MGDFKSISLVWAHLNRASRDTLARGFTPQFVNRCQLLPSYSVNDYKKRKEIMNEKIAGRGKNGDRTVDTGPDDKVLSRYLFSKGNKLVLLRPYDKMQASNSFKW